MVKTTRKLAGIYKIVWFLPLALFLILKMSAICGWAEDRFDSRWRMGSPIEVLVVPHSGSSEEERDVDLMEFRPIQEDYRRFSGRRIRARLKLGRDIHVVGYALAGMEISQEKIDARSLYLLDKKGRLWRADLEEIKGDGIPKPSLTLVPGRFSALQREGSGEVFAIDEKGRLTMLEVEGPVNEGRRLALGLNFNEAVLRINGVAATGLQILTSQQRVLQAQVEQGELRLIEGYALVDQDLPEKLKQSLQVKTKFSWDVRGNPYAGDFWLLDESKNTVWLRSQADGEGQRFWAEFDLSSHLSEDELHAPFCPTQILGLDATSLYLKVGAHYIAIRRVAPEPRALSQEILSAHYFTNGLFSRGVFGGLFTDVHILQPFMADRGKNSRRKDLHVRDIRIAQAIGAVTRDGNTHMILPPPFNFLYRALDDLSAEGPAAESPPFVLYDEFHKNPYWDRYLPNGDFDANHFDSPNNPNPPARYIPLWKGWRDHDLVHEKDLLPELEKCIRELSGEFPFPKKPLEEK